MQCNSIWHLQNDVQTVKCVKSFYLLCALYTAVPVVKYCTVAKVHCIFLFVFHSGGSSDYSIDRVCDDQQSDITMSVPSSRGSLSESRDNVHISQEYLPLGSSPSPQPKSTVGMASWINFTDGSSRSTRKMQSPPSHLSTTRACRALSMP